MRESARAARSWWSAHVPARPSTLVLSAIFVLSLTVYFLIRPDPSASSPHVPAPIPASTSSTPRPPSSPVPVPSSAPPTTPSSPAAPSSAAPVTPPASRSTSPSGSPTASPTPPGSSSPGSSSPVSPAPVSTG